MIDKEVWKQNIERLEEIRRKVTKMYIDMGNPTFTNADWELSKDIKYLKKEYALCTLSEQENKDGD